MAQRKVPDELMDKKVKCGVIGLGKMGVLHSALVHALPEAELTAVCEPNGTLRDGFGTFVPGVAPFKAHQDMLKATPPEAVFICTPPSSHVPIALDCLRSGCHVFIEKPIALSAKDAAPLLDALKTHHKISMVGFMSRFTETFRKARELVASGAIGKVITCSGGTKVSQVYKAGKGWRYSKKDSGGGVLIAQGIHALDLIYWIMGKPSAVNARTSSFYTQTVEDFATALFAWPGGAFGWLNCSWSVDGHRMMETYLEINGETGSIAVDDDNIRVFMRKDGGSLPRGWTVFTKPELASGVPIDIGGPQYTRQDRAFVQAILGGAKVENDVQSAVDVQLLVDSLYQSAENNGETINLQVEH